MAQVLSNHDRLSRDDAFGVYRTMLRIREADQTIQNNLMAGLIAVQYYPAGGQEAIPAAVAPLLSAADYLVTTYRGIHDIVAKGTSLEAVFAEILGFSGGASAGKGGPMHLTDPESGLMVTTGIVGGGLPIAVGLGLAAKLEGKGRVVVVTFGDGATNIGAFHESLNLAALWDLPVLFLCQNNLYAEYTTFADSTKVKSLSGRAAAYGMPGVTVDGTDPDAVHGAARDAIDRARGGGGPTLVEAVAYRLQSHSFGGDEAHIDKAELAVAIDNQPLRTYRKYLIDSGFSSEEALARLEEEVREEVQNAFVAAMEGEAPSSDVLYADVFADPADLPEGPAGLIRTPSPEPDLSDRPTNSITMGQAITDVLDLALTRDPTVILLGEDIADPAGGVMKTTYGLSTKHGRDRVRNTPISEQAIVGSAIGAALAGYKPVAEIMIVDFSHTCMDQIANHAAKLRYMSGGKTGVPLTLRMTHAGNLGSFGAQHSQSLEAIFAHTPGLKVIYPSTPYDAKGLLASCIEDPDPCIFLEPARCYFAPAEVPEGWYAIPFGRAAIRRPGTDATILAYGWTVAEALGAAELLAAEGVEAEVIDLRTLIPFDREAILTSARKTGRVSIVHAGVAFGGFGAEIGSMIHHELFAELKAPVERLGASYTPTPFNKGLEALHWPDAAKIAAAVRRQMAR